MPLENPFTVQTPEDVSASDAVSLFVDVFTDFPKVRHVGHLFLHGPRGSGKSMIFRMLMPDCQAELLGASGLDELGFYSVYFPVKSWFFNLPEFGRMENEHAGTIINEHFMVLHIAIKALDTLAEDSLIPSTKVAATAVKEFAHSVVERRLRLCGFGEPIPGIDESETAHDVFRCLTSQFEELYAKVVDYLRRSAIPPYTPEPFTGPLCGYLDFLLPMLEGVRKLPFMPSKEGPIFLLVDDADQLSLVQTQILNTWVASRTSSAVSIKVSTQMQYKSYRTVTRQTIDTPHDYSDVNISTLYTTKKGKYRSRVTEIVTKRLALANISGTPQEIFPADVKQEEAIRRIAEKYISEWESSGRGYRPQDDALRYARPDFMRSQAGTSKSSPSYSYSGFDQLVHISSGIVRYFLEAAAEMYDEVQSVAKGKPVKQIPPSIQNDVVRKQAVEFLFDDLERLKRDADKHAIREDTVTKLHLLISSLGGLFRMILISDRSERRVFSIAFYELPEKDLQEVLDLGLRYGHFHRSTIGNKEGTGRTRLYIMSRRLAPLFGLDPTSFAGYLFMQPIQLDEAMRRPARFLRSMESRVNAGGDRAGLFEQYQLSLFENEEDQ